MQALYDDCIAVYGDTFEAINEELDFGLKLDHYEDTSAREKDSWRVQPTTLDLFNMLRHKWSQIAGSEVFIECRPVDDVTDPETAEDAKWALETVLYDPLKRYMQYRRRMIMGALAARAWAMTIEFDESIGPYGELYFRLVRPDRVLTAPGWQDLHDITCPYLIEEVPVRMTWLHANAERLGWKNVDDVKADGAALHTTTEHGHPDAGGRTTLQRDGITREATSGAAIVTLLKCWLRYDETEGDPQGTNRFMPLPPDEQYMACLSCGYTEQDPVKLALQRDEQGQLPEYGDNCPNCGEQTERIAHVEEEESYLRYPDGRLIIIARDQDVVLYDDDWPVRCRSFPYMMYRAYEHPDDVYGPSDTSLNWNMQVIANALLRFGYEQMMKNVDILLTPENGLRDADGNPFMFTDAQGQVAYFKDPMAAQYTQHFQGSGIPQGLLPLYEQLATSFQRNMGINDLGLSPQQSKDIPVGTVRALLDSGEIPVAEHVRMLREEESIFFGIVLDYIIATWTEERYVRYLGLGGLQRMKRLKGADIPNVDVVVSASPSLKAAKVEELDTFIKWAQLDPPTRRVAAQLLNISPSLIRQYEEEMRQFQMEQVAQQENDIQMQDAMGQQRNGTSAQPRGGESASSRNGTSRLAGGPSVGGFTNVRT